MARPAASTVAAALLALLAPGCGWLGGVAAVVDNQLDDSDRRPLPPEDPGTPPSLTVATPARAAPGAGVNVSLVLADAQGHPVDVAATFSARDLSSGAVRAGACTPAGPAPLGLASSSGGTPYTFAWAAATDLGDAGAHEVTLTFVASDRSGASLPAATAPFLAGNDAPALVDAGGGFVVASGTSGNVLVEVQLADTTGDVCALGLEYTLEGGAARPLTQVRGGATTGLDTPDGGGPGRFSFVWDTLAEPGVGTTNHAAVTVVVTPTDALGAAGVPRASAAFGLLNNQPPLVVVTEPALGEDDARNVALEVTVFDSESDPVTLDVQASRTSTFAPLPADAVQAVPIDARGVVEARDPALPALAQDEVQAPALVAAVASRSAGHPFVGCTVDALETPAVVDVTLALASPEGVAVESGGASALVADPALAALVRVDLVTGATTPVASGLGRPSWVALEPGGATALVTDNQGGGGGDRLLRVDVASGAVNVLATGLPGLQGVASLSGTEAIVVDDAGRLLRVELTGGAVGEVAAGLVFPLGLALDRPARVAYVAERGAAPGSGGADERVTRISLDTHERSVVCTAAAGGPPGPVGLHLSSDRATLHVTSALGGLYALDRALGARSLGLVATLVEPRGLAAEPLPGGGERALVVCDRGSSALARRTLGTGATYTGTVVAVDPGRGVLRLSPAPAAPLGPGTRLRVRGGVSRGRLDGLASSPGGVVHRLVLDVEEVLDTTVPDDGLFFRVTPRDAAAGGISDTTTALCELAGRYARPQLLALGPLDMAMMGPDTLALADMEQDGDLDVVVHSGSGFVVVFPTDPAGAAAPIRIDAQSPFALAVGDVDGNGLLDIATSRSAGVGLHLELQSPAGTYTGLDVADVAFGAATVALADVDGDGLVDLVAANRTSLGIRYQASPATTPPTFDPAVFVDFDNQGRFLVVDLDADGDLDLASANALRLSVQLQLAPRSFAFAQRLDDPSGGNLPGASLVHEFPLALAAADLDGDGDLDLACATRDRGSVTLVPQVTPGVFAAGAVLPAPSEVPGPDALATGDADGDGDADLALAGAMGAGPAPTSAALLLQGAAGDFSSPARLVSGGLETQGPVSVALGDLDGNGAPDVVVLCLVGSQGTGVGTVAVFRRDRPADAAAPFALASPAARDPAAVAAGDLDGDGDVDVASANASSNDVALFFQVAAPGVFGTSTRLLVADPAPTDVALADLDGDGDLDAVVAVDRPDVLVPRLPPRLPVLTPVPGRLDVFFQVSPGVFTAVPLSLQPPTPLDLVGPRAVVAADLDGDGDLDLASANGRSASNVTVFLQTSPGAFGALPPVPLMAPVGPLAPLDLAAADVDQDGDVDLAACTPDRIELFLQVAPGVFAQGPVITDPALSGTGAVAAADLDRDGDVDLAATSSAGGGLVLFLQGGPGVFGPAVAFLALPAGTTLALDVAAADVDRDGGVDVVGVGDVGVAVHRQVAPGAFEQAEVVLGGAPFDVTVADLNGDGTPDLAVTHPSLQEVRVHLGR